MNINHLKTRRAKGILLLLFLCSSFALYLSVTIYYSPIIITSKSMIPALNVGDIVFIRPVKDFSKIHAGINNGDIVAIRNKSIFLENGVPSEVYVHVGDSTPIIHRAIEKFYINNTYYFITKGDNNPAPDGCTRYKTNCSQDYCLIEYNLSNPVLIPQKYILGKVVYAIPFLGYFKIYSMFITIYLSTLLFCSFILKIQRNLVSFRVKSESVVYKSSCQ
ncbi:MAG: signal peptidase I [Promethearchaeota archaeon]